MRLSILYIQNLFSLINGFFKLNYIGLSALFTLTISAVSAQHANHQTERSLEQTVKHANRKRVEYDLYVKDTLVNYTGKVRKAIALNGQIPAPILFFTEGDTAIIRVHNQMKVETSIHWHGLLLPNEQDGVPNLTTAPIEAGSTHTFTFPLIQSGTYWYHSHTLLQEQSGIYGSIVIYPPEGKEKKEKVIMLSDWTNENPHEVLRSLKRGSDWYAIKKNSVQSWGEALTKGYFKDRAKTEWVRMPAMDISDVYYNRFFINGTSEGTWNEGKPGDKVRLRIINGGSSSYFWLQYAGGKMKVVAADGLNVEPVEVDKILIAVAETYDVEVIIPDDGMAYEFRATAQDISGYASLFLGEGMKMNAPDLPRVNYFEMMRDMNNMGKMGSMDMSGMKGMDMGDMKGMDMKQMNMADTTHQGHKMEKDSSMVDMEMDSTMSMPMDTTMKDMDMTGMDMSSMNMGNMEEVTLSYDMLRSPQPTTLDQDKTMREIKLTLTGNMIRYVWSFDNKTLSQSDKIMIRKGENVRMTLVNNTMMRHPMHLHGHFFRFINEQEEYAPMKHTFDIQPMQSVTIEFYANEEKDWFFHCHILYHMMAGMARVVSYENSPSNTQVSDKDQRKLFKEDKMPFLWGQTKVASDAVFGFVSLSGNRGILGSTYRVSYKNQYEFQPDYERFLDKRQFFSAYVGADIRNTRQVIESGKLINRQVGVLGIRYLLPMFLLTELRIDHRGDVRFQIARNDIPITKRLRLSLVANTDKEYNIDFDYYIHKYIAIHGSYDSDYKFGTGITFLW